MGGTSRLRVEWGRTSQPRTEKVLIARAGKLSCKNQLRVIRLEREGIAEGDTRSTTRSKEAFLLKSPNRFVSILA